MPCLKPSVLMPSFSWSMEWSLEVAKRAARAGKLLLGMPHPSSSTRTDRSAGLTSIYAARIANFSVCAAICTCKNNTVEGTTGRKHLYIMCPSVDAVTDKLLHNHSKAGYDTISSQLVDCCLWQGRYAG